MTSPALSSARHRVPTPTPSPSAALLQRADVRAFLLWCARMELRIQQQRLAAEAAATTMSQERPVRASAKTPAKPRQPRKSAGASKRTATATARRTRVAPEPELA